MSRLYKAITMGLLTGLIGLILIPILFELEKNIGLGLLFNLRGPRKAPSEVIIVTMDKSTADNLSLPTDPEKWPRSLHATLVENLTKEGVSVIAFDIIFDKSLSTNHDHLLAETIRKAGNVVLCECLKKDTIPVTDKKGNQTGELNIEKLESPVPTLAQAAAALAPFPLPKVPIKVSQYWLIKMGVVNTPTLPVAAFQIFALDVYDEFVQLLKGISPSFIEQLPVDKNTILKSKGVKKLILMLRNSFKNNPLIVEKILDNLKDQTVQPVDRKKNKLLTSLIKMYQGPHSRYLNFYGPPGTITTVPYYQILQGKKKTSVNQKITKLNDKAIFIGLSEQLRPQQKDGFHTVFSQESGLGLDISGVEIAATAFANLLEDMPVRSLSLFSHLATIFLWGMALGFLCLLFSPSISAVSVSVLGVFYLSASYYQFKHSGIWYPIVIPLFFEAPIAFFGAVLWKYFDTNRERKNTRRALGYYLPDKIVDQLVKDMSDIKTEGQIVYGTCLMTDAEQYTALSEAMDPKELSSFMNKYYKLIFEPVKQYNGSVSDVIGDSMLALWSTTQPDTALRNQACLAALGIAKAVCQFNQFQGTFQLPTRIALHSGQISMGNIGAIDHYEYRPVGDIVNTVSRLEGLNKYLGTRILVTEDVVYQLDGFLTRRLGKFLLIGKSKPIVVHELLCLVEKSNEKQRRLCQTFSKALSAYTRRSWEDAIEMFYESTKINKYDGPSTFYLEFCKKFKNNPPGEMWDGLVRLNDK